MFLKQQPNEGDGGQQPCRVSSVECRASRRRRADGQVRVQTRRVYTVRHWAAKSVPGSIMLGLCLARLLGIKPSALG